MHIGPIYLDSLPKGSIESLVTLGESIATVHARHAQNIFSAFITASAALIKSTKLEQ